MGTVITPASRAALIALILLVPAAAQAQEQRLRVSFTPAAAAAGGDAELALGGSVGYRFSEHFWFEGDFTWIDAAAGGFSDGVFDVDGGDIAVAGFADAISRRGAMFGNRSRLSDRFGFSLPNVPASIGQLHASTDGQTMVGTVGIRYELPVETTRFRPYVNGGLGINNTDQQFSIARTSLTPEFDESVSHTGYAFSAGAGAAVRMFSAFWADVDAKYFRLSRDRNVMRLGGGVSVRF